MPSSPRCSMHRTEHRGQLQQAHEEQVLGGGHVAVPCGVYSDGAAIAGAQPARRSAVLRCQCTWSIGQVMLYVLRYACPRRAASRNFLVGVNPSRPINHPTNLFSFI